jgi:hypothetical protein
LEIRQLRCNIFCNRSATTRNILGFTIQVDARHRGFIREFREFSPRPSTAKYTKYAKAFRFHSSFLCPPASTRRYAKVTKQIIDRK